MRQWVTLYQKELLEMWRNFKWIWVPLTFILIGIQEPISSYYLPQIIDSLGGLPEGAVIKLPTPSPAEVLIQGLSQYTTLGVLIIVLTTMGVLAGERKSGVAAMILVKPVSYISFVTSKWVGSLSLMWSSFFIGYLATWYYTGILFKWVPVADFFQSFFLNGLWLTLVLTLAVFFSALLLVPGMAGFVSIAIVIVVSLVSSSLSSIFEWSPSQLSNYVNTFLISGKFSNALLPTSLITVACIFILISLSIVFFRKKELAL